MAVTLHLAGYNCNEITCNTLRKGLAIRRIYLRSNKFFLFVWSPEINKLEKMFLYRIDNLVDFQTVNMCACLFCQLKVINKIFCHIHLLSFAPWWRLFILYITWWRFSKYLKSVLILIPVIFLSQSLNFLLKLVEFLSGVIVIVVL